MSIARRKLVLLGVTGRNVNQFCLSFFELRYIKGFIRRIHTTGIKKSALVRTKVFVRPSRPLREIFCMTFNINFAIIYAKNRALIL